MCIRDRWYAGEVQSIKVTVDYPLEFGIDFEVSAITEGVETLNYTTIVILRTQSNPRAFEVKVKPLEPGKLFIRGVTMSFCNLVCDHYVAPNGTGVYAIEEESKSKGDICEVEVLSPIPRIATQLESALLFNGSLLGMKNEKAEVKLYIKNTSNLSIKIQELKLFVHTKQVTRTFLIEQRDLIAEFNESPVHGKWYSFTQFLNITEKIDMYIFEFHFSSNPEFEVVEKFEVPITVESPTSKERVVLPSLICDNWECMPSVECPDIMEAVRKNSKKEVERFICCSDRMTLVVELRNLCPYPFLVRLSHYGKVIAESEVEVQTKKNLAAEIPYELNVTDNVSLEWYIPDLQRSGQDLIKNFLKDRSQVLQALPYPIKIDIESDYAEKNATVIKGKVGNLVQVTVTIINIDTKPLANVQSTIEIFKCTADSYILINKDLNAIAISGELTQHIDELAAGESYKHTIAILFTRRNVYRIGAVCTHEQDRVTVYVGNKGLTFETTLLK
eukprot:TRINITY_DN17188_c0_g2_i1.p1 TRINITY_DN17188_c0_g2~~TRINITY_DN17188_c0_g2_i1.p1  ORF type:complete len:502 (-),score=103.50 TRINITY_DN17188_c0_g2_i1:108-1613(-)